MTDLDRSERQAGHRLSSPSRDGTDDAVAGENAETATPREVPADAE